MRHLNSQSHFRHALFALQDADGYVEALLGMARDQSVSRRTANPMRPMLALSDRRNAPPRPRASLH